DAPAGAVALLLLAHAERLERAPPHGGDRRGGEGGGVRPHGQAADGRDVVGQHGEDGVGDEQHAVGPAGRLLGVDEPVAAPARLEDEVAAAHGVAPQVLDEGPADLGRHAHRRCTSRPSPSAATSVPTTAAAWRSSRRSSTARPASPSATTTTMPRPRLKTRAISASSTSPRRWISVNTRGTSQDRRSSSASTPAGSTRGRLPTRPPPVTWATARTSTSPSSRHTAGA